MEWNIHTYMALLVDSWFCFLSSIFFALRCVGGGRVIRLMSTMST